jgi:hypothetical protein
MADNLLHNGDFEADWSEEQSHRCMIFPTQGQPYPAERGNIFTPPHWTVWFLHGLPVQHDPSNTVGWAQPEVRDAWASGDPRRVRAGQKAVLFFTFFRIHDGGFFQQVATQPGTRLRLSAWAHAWSNHKDPNHPDLYPHPDDPRWSEGQGVGYNNFYATEGQVSDAGAKNFTFWVGIDPTGGTNPYASSVVWGQGAHIYNAYRQVPAVEAVAQGNAVTVFLRSRALWPFKHCDAYWDEAMLEVVAPPAQTEIVFEPAAPQAEETVQATVVSNQPYQNTGLRVNDPTGATVPVTAVPVTPPAGQYAWRWSFTPVVAGTHAVVFTAAGGAQQPLSTTLVVRPRPVQPPTGLPREQYSRTYVLLPPQAGPEWVEAILDSGAWERNRWTIGGSADDAGIGALADKTVLAVNPQAWGDDLAAFFRRYYPGTRYVPLNAATPAELRRLLENR